RRSAFFSGIPALLRAHAPIEDGIRIVDLAATDARQVATKQRLQHQHEGITLSAKQLLLEHVPADTQLFVERNSHYASLPNVTNQLHRLTRPAVGTRLCLSLAPAARTARVDWMSVLKRPSPECFGAEGAVPQNSILRRWPPSRASRCSSPDSPQPRLRFRSPKGDLNPKFRQSQPSAWPISACPQPARPQPPVSSRLAEIDRRRTGICVNLPCRRRRCACAIFDGDDIARNYPFISTIYKHDGFAGAVNLVPPLRDARSLQSDPVAPLPRQGS